MKSDHHEKQFYTDMWNSLINKGAWKGDIWNRRKNGETYLERLSISAMKNEHGKTTHFVGVYHDISELKQSRERLQHQASHDALTGLPNRRLFNDRLKMALLHTNRQHKMLSVLYLDIDGFKNINNSMGHYVGDLYLIEVAKIFKNICRQEDTVARLGGDEFIFLMIGINDPKDVATLVNRIFQGLAKPILIKGHELFVSVSIGITIHPIDGDDVETLLKNADIAMYRAKETGRNTFQFFAKEIENKIKQRISLENALRKGLENQEFQIYYQPTVSLHHR